MGRERLNVAHPNQRVVIFEDAVAGVRAGKDAGAIVIAVLETHSREALEQAGADYIIDGLDKVRIRKGDSGGLFIDL